MRAGKMDRRIVLQSASNTVNDAGTPILTWKTKATVWAELVQRSTREYIRAQGAQDEAVIIFRIRWLPGISTADRVVFDGRTFNIREVATIDRKRGIELRCIDLTGGSIV